jgi:hypothetical protein
MMPASHIKGRLKHLGVSHDVLSFIMSQILVRDSKIEWQASDLTIKSRVCVPLSMKNVEVLSTESDHSKLTINPCSGRITLKVSYLSSAQVTRELLDFVSSIIKSEFQPMTYRGSFKWNSILKLYYIDMQTENKKFNLHFKTEPKI